MRNILLLAAGLLMFSCQENKEMSTEPVKVTLHEDEGKFGLKINGAPFYINGAGLEFGNIESLAKHRGNSFRTWRTDNGQRSGKEVLDEAYENGLMVTMGIEVARERHGFDYNDDLAVQEQLERIKKEVLELKDHPALMIWAIGNELNLSYENPKVWNAVNDISKMIHEVDPNHLTTTTLAGISEREVNRIKERASDLDLLSVQMYGDLPNLPKLVREFGWEGAYMVTEWGATGHWEVPTTSWGAPIEENSTLKAAHYLERYNKGIAIDKEQCIGSYVFLWGNKQERTPTWYGIFLEDGKETESVDVMHYIWNGEYPKNRTPQIKSFTINKKIANDNVILNQGEEMLAEVEIFDFEGDQIDYRWEILLEATEVGHGGDYEERPDDIVMEILSETPGMVLFKAPAVGNYRLFIYANDGSNHSATANIPFRVE
ncbi:MAG: glycoside hydrolase family 2 TIM barrel-domain containing protein [Flavobacteriaceae bacterium]